MSSVDSDDSFLETFSPLFFYLSVLSLLHGRPFGSGINRKQLEIGINWKQLIINRGRFDSGINSKEKSFGGVRDDDENCLDDKLYINDDNIASTETDGNQCWFNNNELDEDEDDNDNNNDDKDKGDDDD